MPMSSAGSRFPVARIPTLVAAWAAIPCLVVLAFVDGCGSGDAVPPLRIEEDLVLGLDPDLPFGSIADVAVDSRGNLYVLDRGFAMVRKFNANGTHLGDLGRTGEGPGEFRNPSCLAIGPRDRVYIAGMTPDVTVLDADGAPVTSFRRHCPNVARSIAVDAEGNVFVCCGDPASHLMIHKYGARTHQYVTSFSDSYAAGTDTPPMVERAYAIGDLDLAPDGRLHYLQWAPQLVRVFDRAGGLLAEHPVRVDETPGPPAPDVEGNAVTFRLPEATSNAVVALAGGRYLVALLRTPPDGEATVTVDLRDADGALVASLTRRAPFGPAARDAAGRILVLEERDVPVLVRYRITSPRM